MPDRINAAIARLERDELVLYAGGHTGAELTREAGRRAALSWADYINIGMEHGVLDLAGLGAFMQGWGESPAPQGRSKPAVIVELPVEGASEALVRANAWQVRQILGCGVHGLLLCHAENVDAVRAFVEAARYSFRDGTRGAGAQGSAGAVWGIAADEYLERADPWPLNPHGELLLGLKIENRRALANAYETTAVPGIAFAEWGPADMSMSYGYRGTPADIARPELQAARERVFDACRKAGIAFLDGVSEDDIAARIAAGVRISPGSPHLAKLRDAQVA